MKSRHLVSGFLIAGLLCIPVSAFTKSKPRASLRRNPFCVQCAFRGDCRSCTSGGGAVFCETFNCGACEESDNCSGGPGGILSTRQATSADHPVSDGEEPLRISSRVIRDIGATHPRFAITLAEMNVYGLSVGERRVYWTPIKFASPDVEAFLSKEAHSAYFKRYNREVRKLNRLIQEGELSDIVYAVSIKKTEDGSWSIRMQVQSELATASVDPPYSALDIKVRPSRAIPGNVGQSSRKEVVWQFSSQVVGQ